MVREQRVVLDADLAEMYGVATRALNQAVKRNLARSPEDFAFQLTSDEAAEWEASRSQTVTLKRGTNLKYRPWAFTEHGALMAANILRSERAVAARATCDERGAVAQLEMIDHRLLEHDQALVIVWNKIKELARPSTPLPMKPKPRIGFHP